MEILSPAGSISALKAAIKGGADAVYLGLGEHNARIKSNDFNADNISKWVSYAHLFGVKVYVTLNTAVTDEEVARVLTLAELSVKCGVDALIVSDLGIASILSACSDVPLHLSTQAGVQNSYDARALKGLRIKRVILSRETPPDMIAEIKKYVDEVEIFVQGAMCVSFSGGCLLGSKIYGASGNRGICNQGCRLTYTACDESGKELKSGKLLSPFDLSLGEKVRELASCCVDSIKIEGRLKRPLYVYNATKYYRELLSGLDGKESLRDMKESFHRGFTDGYSLVKSKNIINPLTSSHIGVPVGTIERVIDRKGYKYALVRSQYDFVKGDGAKILRNGMEVGGSDITKVVRLKDLQEIPVSSGVSVGDMVCLTTNARKVDWAERVVNTLDLDLEVSGDVGENLILRVSSAGRSVVVKSNVLAEASRSSDNAALLSKLSKVGGTDFSLRTVKDNTARPLYVNPSELAEMRRKAFSALRDEIIAENTPRYHIDLSSRGNRPLRPIEKPESIFEVDEINPDLYADADAFVLDPSQVSVSFLKEQLRLAGFRPCYLRLPKILREKELPIIRNLLDEIPRLGVYADNLYGVALARDLGREYIAGFGLNVFNCAALSVFRDAKHIATSVECTDSVGDLAFAAGKVRLMSFAHCPFSVVYGTKCETCDRSRDRLYYKTGAHRYLILRHRSASCDFTMYEDRVTRYPTPPRGVSAFYSFIGLNLSEKRDMMKWIGGKSE